MVSRRRSAGFSFLEGTIALVLVGTVAGSLLLYQAQSARVPAAALRAAAAVRLAEGALDATSQDDLVEGERRLAVPGDAPLPDVEIVRTAHEEAPGLWRLEARVRWTEPGETRWRETALVTLVAEERVP